MSRYCTVDDVKALLTKEIIIGDNYLEGAHVITSEIEFYIDQSAGIIDSYISTIYRVPLIKYKEPVDYSAYPIVFNEVYPFPSVLTNARLAAALVYDKLMSAEQTPNVSEVGQNFRSLAMDDLKLIQAGQIQLKNQVCAGMRFARQELFDPSRMPSKGDIQTNNRAAGK